MRGSMWLRIFIMNKPAPKSVDNSEEALFSLS